MYCEIEVTEFVLMIPLTPEQERRAAYLDETLTDPQWETRDHLREECILAATTGKTYWGMHLGYALTELVGALMDAIEDVDQAKADAFDAEVAALPEDER